MQLSVAEGTVNVVLGVLLVLANGAVFLLLEVHRLLRRKYILFSFIILHGCLSGIVCIEQGVAILEFDTDHDFVTAKQCLSNPLVILDMYVYPMGGVTLLMMSVDRLCAIAFPFYYYRNIRSLTVLLIVASTLAGVAICGCAVASVFLLQTDLVPASCRTSDLMANAFYYPYISLRVAFGLLSIVVMLIVLLMLETREGKHRLATQFMPRSDYQLTAFQRWQLSFTRTMLISCLFSLVLFVLPGLAVIASTILQPVNTPQLVCWTRFVNFLNSFNMLVVTIRCQKEIRSTLHRMIFRRYKNNSVGANTSVAPQRARTSTSPSSNASEKKLKIAFPRSSLLHFIEAPAIDEHQ